LLMQRKIRFFEGETEVAIYDAMKSLDAARR